MISRLVQKLQMRVKGNVIKVIEDKTYDMGCREMPYCQYIVQLENGNEITLSDRVYNSHVEQLGLTINSTVVVNGFNRLVGA